MNAPPDPPRGEPRQRWRLVVGRSAETSSGSQRELGEAWERAVVGSGLPVVVSDGERPRPRVSFGAPLQSGVAAERELIDIVLTQRLPVWTVRERLRACLPDGWSLVDLHDVWLAGPPLAGRVVAADYRIVLSTSGIAGAATPDRRDLARAIERLNSAGTIPRERAKGGTVVPYDLRPLLDRIELLDGGPPAVVRARTRFHPELGTGRPEEVAAAIGQLLGHPIEADQIVRERVILAEELAATPAGP